MSVISLPSGLCPNGFMLRLATTQRAFASPFGGSQQVVDLLNDRWLISLSLPNGSLDEGAAVEAFIAALRGMSNTVSLFHWVRPVPRGSMRGVPTASGAQGASSITISTVAGATLRAGDMLGASGLLLQAASDATANGAGVMVLPIVNRLRRAILPGTAVIWDKPTAPFRLISPSAVQYVPGYAPEVSLDFQEDIS